MKRNDVRRRQRGTGPTCPRCRADAFCYCSRRAPNLYYPEFLGRFVRKRYYRCADPNCGHTFEVRTDEDKNER